MESMLFWTEGVFSFLIGLVLGSFANVLIVRLPKGGNIVTPSSHCLHCQHRLGVWDLVPLLSFLWLRGRCRYCQKKISWRYPLVECMVGALCFFAFLKTSWGWSLWIRDWWWLMALVVIGWIDIDHRIIPNELSLGGVLWGWVSVGVSEISFLTSFLGAALGFLIFFFFGFGYEKLTKKEGLGGGDVKLLAMLGAFLGPLGVFYVVLISSILGSMWGVSWALVSGKKQLLKVELPYGPFLVFGALAYYFFGDFLWLQSMIQI